VALKPDGRWANFIGGVDDAGRTTPFTVEVLQDIAASCADVVAELQPCGSLELLDLARDLIVQSWFCYELLVQACLTSLQAVEAAFRQVLYPEASERAPFMQLVNRAAQDGTFSHDVAELLRTGVAMRNLLSHPGGGTSYTPGMAYSVVMTSHLVVRDICRLRGLAAV
jgi:hypothetical protein